MKSDAIAAQPAYYRPYSFKYTQVLYPHRTISLCRPSRSLAITHHRCFYQLKRSRTTVSAIQVTNIPSSGALANQIVSIPFGADLAQILMTRAMVELS